MAATDRSRSEAAKQRRQDQLQRWHGSETDLADPETRGSTVGSRSRPGARVRFNQGAVFMAACSAGDREEVAALLRQGADINHANIDGLTALHQACIDENAEMVEFLVESGSDVNRGDNEGWTPLHATASCGFIQIAKYLIEHSAHVGAANSEGELPLDVATEEAMKRLLKAEIKKQGVDVERARGEEERVMLQDAMAVLAGSGSLAPHPNTQATALHVAATKGYSQVLKVLLQCGMDVDARDIDGWTPLHAAAHWGQEEASTLLAEHMCDMTAANIVGQTPVDVADENLVDCLEELQKKQNILRIEQKKLSQPPVIETSPPIAIAPVRPRRTSISRMSSKEKICLHERERHAPPALQIPPAEEEEEEPNPETRNPSQSASSKASSSSSSEEESESESDVESEKAKTREIINNLNNKRNSSVPIATSPATGTTGNQVKKVDPVVKSSGSDAPGSWRTSLRKAGSSGALGSVGASDPSEPSEGGGTAAPRGTPSVLGGMTRSASSPRLSSEADNKEPRLARVPPTQTRRLVSISDNNQDNSSSWLLRSSSYTRRLNSQSAADVTSSNPYLPRSSSYGRRLDEAAVTTGTTSTGLSRLTSLVAQRQAQEQAEKKEPGTTSNSVTTATTTTGEPESKQRRKSYLTPVRDEEAEAQRKARSRHARQSRRSTQGVTLTDLQEAENAMNRGKEKKREEEEREGKKREEEKREEEEREEKKKEEEEREGKQKKVEEGVRTNTALNEVTWRSRIANLQKSDLLGLTNPAGAVRPERRDPESLMADLDERGIRERRRARAQRRARAGENFDHELSGEEGNGQDPQTDRQTSDRSHQSFNDCNVGRGSETKDYKKLFDDLSRENTVLQSQLQDTQRTVTQTRMDLDKATQRQDRFSDCSALLEMEKKERRMLERRVAELEEELKVLGDLRADNQRLKDENGALIRVISKLSK